MTKDRPKVRHISVLERAYCSSFFVFRTAGGNIKWVQTKDLQERAFFDRPRFSLLTKLRTLTNDSRAVKCQDLQKTLAKLQVARSPAGECIAPNTRSFVTKIASQGTKSAAQRIRVATIVNIRSGARLSFAVIHYARSRDFAAALPNQLKLITSFQFAPAANVSRSQTDKALANLAILGRRRQKTPIFHEAKGRGSQISTNPKLCNPYLRAHRREKEKIVKLA
jgi:hypothetical protein